MNRLDEQGAQTKHDAVARKDATGEPLRAGFRAGDRARRAETQPQTPANAKGKE